ncbi:hypothetical protein UCDDS831_g02222 [Diplodia seriata]|uniref:Uncharacterized protein n=1 Tax=Diplodia seriata TaxID=420778 RepID=A0A0G2EQ37_9PEZI|nr:hypothetical protein UCDDS831_g02222 [Diplodia seriata]
MPVSASAPAGRLPRLLPADVSHYTEPTFNPDIVSTSSTSLAELAHLIRLQSYQEQRRCHARVRLHRSLVANALSARLVHCGELVHRTLVDHFRSDDKKSFAQLYNALHDVRNSCDATRRYALLEPDLEFGKTKTLKNERVNSFSTFMHEIPTKIRDDLLEFLSELRTNPDFLATRITSLSQQELASLTTFRQALDPIDSVMALQARGKPVPSAQKSQVLSGSTAVERLLSFQRHDPLSALIYTIFANSSGPDSTEDLRRTDIWSTTCARLITEGKPGSDKFIKSVLDAWAGMREWPGKTNLELYLMEVLQDGQFLLEKTEDVPRQRSQPEARNTKDTIAADEFYDRSVLKLFEVIDDEPSAGGIPEGILEIGTAILKKLEDSRKHRTAAQTFIVSRWFFSTYLLNAIIHPESQGIMTGHHITEHARQKILKEIAIRAQKQVLDMTYNCHHPLNTGNGYTEHENKVEPTEEYGQKIRITCSEMTRILNATGSCHPCAEKWAVLYVSSDGKELRTRMRKDTEIEDDPDEDSTESESEDEGHGDRMELENDYHSIKMAIVKLVEEYEIPKELTPETHGRSNSNADLKDPANEKPSVLITMLEAAMNQCQARSDFVNAHLYFKTLQQLRKIQSASLTRNGYAALLNYFGRGPRESVAKSSSAIEEFEAWFVWLKQSQERHDMAIEDMMTSMKSLRDKMWYITDVRNSAGYEEARNVALALKIMGQPTKTPDGKPIQTHRPRTTSKVANNFLLKTEAQVLDLMAAPSDHGGPNKLADEQSDMTLRWLKQYAIESSFCKGEERIHRFCLELDKCVNKLVGDGILDGPVLWSSELYRRDKEVLDTGRQKGDLYLTGVGTLSIAGDEEYESHLGKSSLRSLDFAQRASNSSLRSVHRNGSQQSFDSVMLKQSATVNEDKRRFLLDLKQTLTGLLLSDLGTIVFSNGSETDSWFSGDLGEECLVRKEEEEKRRKRAARKKSMRNLRSAAKEQRPGSENQSSTDHSSSGTDATARSAGISAKKAGLLEFPFNSAFRRLLHKFATHPNPFSKLHALYELELLIIASLSSRTGRSYSRRETLPTVPQSPTLGSVPEYSSREATANHVQAQNLEEAIANCEGRRSHSMMNNGQESASPSFRNGARSPTGPPSTDMIVDVLTGLFRDAEIRPKTLFRDLQYIASFVPAQMLDKTARGKAFWDAGLAALGLKQDICRIMVEIADDIVALNTQNRSAALQHAANGSSGASEKAGITNATVAPAPDDPLNKFTMEDAAHMLIITAKEGDAVAERELAIFYLTHPDLLPRTTLPLTKPTEVFKAELLQRDRKREDPARSDPITMCVAQHWMEMSKRGGDQLATKYLRARDEMERIP